MNTINGIISIVLLLFVVGFHVMLFYSHKKQGNRTYSDTDEYSDRDPDLGDF